MTGGTDTNHNKGSSSFGGKFKIFVFILSFWLNFVFNDVYSYFIGDLTWKSDVFEYICFVCRSSNYTCLLACGGRNARRIVFFFNKFSTEL